MSKEDVCPKHHGGKHCWHEYGQKGYRGRYETSSPVQCCHCEQLATKRENAAELICYPSGAETRS
jgi:hypothetical protein